MPLKVLTANRLIDGYPIWYGADGEWSRDMGHAAVADSLQACALLEQAGRQAIADNKIVDAVLIDVENHDGRLYALRLRERIRAGGPISGCVQNRHV